MLYSALFMTTKVTGRPSCAAVQSAWGEYIAAPSPTTQTTGARSRPSEEPTAAGMPQPSTPPRIEAYWCGVALSRKARRCAIVAGASSTIATLGADRAGDLAGGDQRRDHRVGEGGVGGRVSFVRAGRA